MVTVRITHSQLVAKMGAVAVAHHELHRHVHRTVGVTEPEAPAAHLPAVGVPPKPKGS